MKKLIKLLFSCAFAAALAATTALSQPYPGETWTLYENGTAFLTGPSLTGFATGSLQVDPVSGITGLYFNLGAPFQQGDVLMLEPVTFETNDLIRFDGRGGAFFFSDMEPGDPNPDLADVPQIPLVVQGNSITIFEVGDEGNNGAIYIPTQFFAGYDTSGQFPGITFNFVSDIPEPSSAVLVLGGVGIWGMRMMRGKRGRS